MKKKETIKTAGMLILLGVAAFLFGMCSAGRALESSRGTVDIPAREWISPDIIEHISLYNDDEEEIAEIIEAAEGASARYSVPMELVLAVIETESGFKKNARNGGCYGLMQIHKVNHRWLRKEFGRELDFCDISDNIYAGAYVLAGLVQAYAEGEDYNYALMAYNGGEGDLRRMIRDGYTSSAYSRKVIGRMAKYGN